MSSSISNKENMNDSDQLKKKIFIYSVAEVVLIILLFVFSFFLFRIMVG